MADRTSPATVVVLAVLALVGCASAQGGAGDCRQDALDRHNALRQRHGAPPLVWDDALMQKEKDWVTQLANNGCGLNHWGGPENLHTSGRDMDHACAVAVDQWYAELDWYIQTASSQTPYTDGQSNMQSLQQQVNSQGGSFSIMTGHYTQVVWKTATRVGCWAAVAQCGVVVGCAYDAGNTIGDDNYLANVLPEQSPSSLGNCPDDALSALNSLRKTYGAVDLSWDTALAARAKAYAVEQANQGCSFGGSHELSLASFTLRLPMRNPCLYGAQNMFYERKNIFNPYLGDVTPKDWTQRSAFPTVAWRAATKVGCYVARGPADCVVMACKFNEGQDQVFDDATVQKNVVTNPGAPVIAPPVLTTTGGKDKDAQCKSDAAGGWCENNGFRDNGDIIAEICPESCGPVLKAALQKTRQGWLDAGAAAGPDTAENTYKGAATSDPATGPGTGTGPTQGGDNTQGGDTTLSTDSGSSSSTTASTARRLLL